jgi:capsular exopolysaccharide synthesis family protein
VPRDSQTITGDQGEGGSRHPVDEAYALLAINLQARSSEGSLGSILVTEASSRKGKNAAAANLASATAQSGRNTLVVDADLRQPTVHKTFGLSNAQGLTNVLDGAVTPAEAVQASDVPSLSVLTTGPLPSNPPALLASVNMADSIRQLTERFELVVLESPSTAAAPDAAAVGRVVDGVVVLLDQDASTDEQLRAALMQLQTAGARMLGLVIVKKNSRQRDLQ